MFIYEVTIQVWPVDIQSIPVELRILIEELHNFFQI